MDIQNNSLDSNGELVENQQTEAFPTVANADPSIPLHDNPTLVPQNDRVLPETSGMICLKHTFAKNLPFRDGTSNVVLAFFRDLQLRYQKHNGSSTVSEPNAPPEVDNAQNPRSSELPNVDEIATGGLDVSNNHDSSDLLDTSVINSLPSPKKNQNSSVSDDRTPPAEPENQPPSKLELAIHMLTDPNASLADIEAINFDDLFDEPIAAVEISEDSDEESVESMFLHRSSISLPDHRNFVPNFSLPRK